MAPNVIRIVGDSALVTQSAETFAQLLTEGVHRIRIKEAKTVRLIQDELGYALGRQGGSAIERWRKGYLPPHAADVETLAQILVDRGELDRAWIEQFLESAGYPQPEAFCDTLFPSVEGETERSPSPTPSEPSRPFPHRRPSPGLMASLGILGLLALAWLVWPRTAPRPSAALPTFPDDTYGLLLLDSPDDASGQQFTRLLEGSLLAKLAESGLTAQTAVALYTSASGPDLAALQAQSGASVVVQILFTEGETEYIGRLQLTLAEDAPPALRAIADALSAPFPTPSLSQANDILANRLAVMPNAALGYIALHDGDYEQCSRRFNAVLFLSQGLALSFNRAEASHVALATCLDALGRAQQARAHYQQAVDHNPDFAQGHFGLGNYWYSQHDFRQARAYYERTVALAEIDPLASAEVTSRAYAGLGNIALAEQRFHEAITAFDKAITYDDTHPAYYLARSQAYYGLTNWPAAAADLHTCIDVIRAAEAATSAYLRQVEADCLAWLEQVAERTLTPTPDSPTATPTETPTLTQTPIPVTKWDWDAKLSTPRTTPPLQPPSPTAVVPSATSVPPAPAPPSPPVTMTPPLLEPTQASPPPKTSTPILPTLPATQPPLGTVTPIPTETMLPATPTVIAPPLPATPVDTPTLSPASPTPTPLPPTIPPSLTPPTPLPPTTPPSQTPTTPLPPTIPPTPTPLPATIPPSATPSATP